MTGVGLCSALKPVTHLMSQCIDVFGSASTRYDACVGEQYPCRLRGTRLRAVRYTEYHTPAGALPSLRPLAALGRCDTNLLCDVEDLRRPVTAHRDDLGELIHSLHSQGSAL